MTTPVIGPDGALFAGLFTTANIWDPCQGSSSIYTLSLLQIAPGGSTTVTPIKVDNNVGDWNYVPSNVIPDGQGGALFAWSFAQGEDAPYQSHITHFSTSGSTDLSVPGVNYGNPYEMVLGENGVAFANNDTTITAFNLNGMTPLWTYQAPAGDWLSIVAATGDGGLMINDSVQGLIALDVNGSPGPATPAPAGAAPWTSGYWLTYGTLPGLASGPLAYLAANAWPALVGPAAEQNRSPKPEVLTYIPFQPGAPGSGYTALQAAKEVNRDFLAVGLDTRANSDAAASRNNFLIDMAELPRGQGKAIAYIGHSLGFPFVVLDGNENPVLNPDGTNQIVPASVGLFFYAPGPMPEAIENRITIVKTPDDSSPDFFYRFGSALSPDPYHDLRMNYIPGAAQVVFIAACYPGEVFQSLWAITKATQGRALIVPSVPAKKVNLVHAVSAWIRFAQDLQRMSASRALNDLNNTYLPSQSDSNGPFLERWKLIGDPNAQIKY